jgi:hypothetical protein
MQRLLIIVALLGLLAGAIWFAAKEWIDIDVGAIPAWGFAAMAFGVLFSLAVGIGLMALVFYSSRHGYDDAAGGDRQQRD